MYYLLFVVGPASWRLEISKRTQTLSCARPRKSPPFPAPDADTQAVDLSPIAKSIRDNFELARADTLQLGQAAVPEAEALETKPLPEPSKPEQPPTEAESPAAAQDGQLAEAAEMGALDQADQGHEGDLFFAEAKVFVTRESQFGEDAPERTRAKPKGKAKAKAKTKSAARAKAACKAKPKAKAKAKAKSKSAAKPKTKGPRKPKAALDEDDDDDAWDKDDIAGADAGHDEPQTKDLQECPEQQVDTDMPTTTKAKPRKAKEPSKAKEASSNPKTEVKEKPGRGCKKAASKKPRKKKHPLLVNSGR